MSTPELLEASVTAWMFTDEDLDGEESSTESPSGFSAFSFDQSPAIHSLCSPISPLSSSSESAVDASSLKRSNKAKTLFQTKVKSPSIDCPPRTMIDWRSYYNSLTPTSASASHTPPTLTPTPTTATTRVGTPCSPKSSTEKPRLSVIIPSDEEPSKKKEKTFARKRRAVPRPLSLWDISNARGNKPHATSLPGSPFILFKEVEKNDPFIVETPCDILSAVEFDLQAALQSVTQSIPVSVRKVRGYEDQWKYYREDTDEDEDDDLDDDDDYMSDPGTSIPDSAYSPIELSPYVPKKVYPAVQRGRQNPFPVRPVFKSQDVPTTREARVELLRKRYADIKAAAPVEREALKSALVSP